ncbi:TetR/AcrR family transcriptional regulator [Nitriliruptor alkaliphilus]|uniref:TetR/AcrR family transcriptional regulator n=1 Tax=Nitriliruptor alkaliphilus TaxID=427918 RepID=UPI000695DAA0|nr:TetR/AcrR family transcriptional regulator [Nitriliruptor alkaliphilus]
MQYTGSGDPTRAIVLLWDAEDGPKRGPAPTVGKKEIVGAAVDIADEVGLDALTMRGLAGRLGVTAMSLYPRIDSKPVLLDLMVDHVLGELLAQAPPDDADWRDRLEHDAVATWELHHRHPWLAELGAGRSALGPAELALHERQLAAFDGLELSPELIGEVIGAVGSYVRGAVRAAVEADQAPARTRIGHRDYWQRRGAALAQVVTPALRQRFPRLEAMGVLDALFAGTPGSSADASSAAADAFQRGLGYLLDGVSLKLVPPRHP